MGYIDGNLVPLITMIAVNMVAGMVNSLLKKVLDGGINHMVIATYRFGISTIFLLPIAYFWERETRPKLTVNISCQLFVSALFGSSLMQYFYLLGLSYTSATLGSAFSATLPSLTFIMALIFGFEKLNIRTKVGNGVVLGTLISLAGALLLAMYQGIPLSHSQVQGTISNNHTGHENWIKGCILLFIGVLFFSSWMLIQAKINVKYPCPYTTTVILSAFGAFQCVLLSLIKTRHLEGWNIFRDEVAIITVIVAGVVAQGFGTVGISWCLKQRGPVFTTAFSPVGLISATLFDFLILHRILYLGSIIGSVVVVIGLYIFLWSKSKQVDCKNMNLPTNMVEEEKVEEGRRNVIIGQFLVAPMTP